MNRLHRFIAASFVGATLLVHSSFASAACTSPSGAAGSLNWNTGTTQFQYCDGTTWQNFGVAASFGAGTLGAPGWAVTGDTDTGLWEPAANTLSISAGGVEVTRFNTVASGVNYLTMLPGIAGTPATVTIGAAGASTDVNIAITPKGVGGITTQGSASIQFSALNSSNAPGTAIQGYAMGVGSANIGVYARAASPTGKGILGIAESATGANYGGWFESDSIGGISLFAVAGNAATKALVVKGAASQTGDLAQFQNSSGTALTVVNASGNVGIGNTSPGQKLDVSGNINFGSGGYLSGNANTSYFGAGNVLVSGGGTSDTGIMTAGNILFGTNAGAGNYERMRITSTGSVGIGTTTVAFSTDTARYLALSGESVGAGAIGELGLGGNVSGTSGALGALAFYNAALGVSDKRNAQIYANNDGATNSGALYFATWNAGSFGLRMSIDHLGNVGIGTASPAGTLNVYTTNTCCSNPGIGLTGSVADLDLQIKNVATGGRDWRFISSATASGVPASLRIYDATAGADRIVVNSSGNVGIGTTAPASPAGFTGVLHLRNAANASYVVDANGTYRAEFGVSSGGGWLSTVDSLPMRFATGASERMRLDASGNLGIGTTNPARPLSLYGTSILQLSNSTTGATTTDGAQLGLDAGGAAFLWNYENNILYFGTNNAERMRIDASGNVGIGTTGPTSKLHVQAASGNVAIYGWTNNESDGAVKGYNNYASAWGALGYANYGVYCNGTICGGTQAWTNSSDARLKTAIHDLPADKGLDTILKLRPVSFHWKDAKQDATLGERLGFIAQEVEIVLPQMVTRGGTTTLELADGERETVKQVKSLSYAEFVVPLVKAVQELKADNDNLRHEVEELRREIRAH